ncbi:MAG: hypothetical protein ABR556_03695 [Pyrinomonadaceae bacterium]
MPGKDEKDAATLFLDENPELRTSMSKSKKFSELKKRSLLFIDGEQLYVVKGDTLGNEQELYLDGLIKGSNPANQDELYRELFLELDDNGKSLIMERRKRR